MRLYKYIGLNSLYGLENCQDIINSKKIWVSDFKSLNDPFEFKFIRSKEQDTRSWFIKALENSTKGILSLSGVNDDLLLWSHYASGHNGICFEFESEEDSILRTAKAITYSTEMPKVSNSIDDSALYNKAKAWAYEKEYRVLISGVTNAKIQLNSKCLKAVYFGMNIGSKETYLLYDLCKVKNLPVFQSETINEDYSLKFKSAKDYEGLTAISFEAKRVALEKIINENS